MDRHHSKKRGGGNLYKASDRELYTNMHKENKLVAVDASSSKLVVILRADTFESGAHIDFYDE